MVGGEKVGVVGIDVKKKTMESSSPSPGTELTDEVIAAQVEIDLLKADGVDKIIVLSHVGLTNDKSFASQLSGVDVMVGGDSHSLLGDANKIAVAPGGTPTEAYPAEVTNKDNEKVCVVQAWHYSRAVGVLTVDFDANGVVTSCSGGPKFPVGEPSTLKKKLPRGSTDDPALTSTDQGTVMSLLANNDAVMKPEHQSTKDWIATNKGQIALMQEKKIATFDVNYCLARIPGFQSSEMCNGCESYLYGGPACSLVAKGFLLMEKTADIAIQKNRL